MPSDSTPIRNNQLLNRSLYFASFLPVAMLVLVFGAHAYMGVTGAQELRDIVGGLGFGATLTAILVFFAGIHDGIVAVLLVVKGKLVPSLPWWALFFYAGAWTIVPRAMIWYGGGPFEWIEVLIFGGMAAAAYACHVTRPRLQQNSVA